MIKNVFSVGLMLLLLSFVNIAYGNTSILLLGDSLSASYGMKENQGWVYKLNERLEDNKAGYRIINASISGETTAGGLSRIEGILTKTKVDHLIIELGGNDGLRGFNPVLIKNNLLQIIEIAKKHNVTPHIMNVKITPNYGPRYNQMFEAIFPEVANEANIDLLPFFMNDIAVKPELMQADGIHPTVEAQPLIVNIMAQTLENMELN
ncbi:arylesterase [Thalassotalea fusca]